MSAYEDHILSRIDRSRGLSDNPVFVERVQSGWEDLRPQMTDFTDVYSELEVKQDQRDLEKIKSNFQVRGEKAIAGEVVIMEGIYEEQWLSEEVEVMPASEYDDVKYGIDVVLRFEKEDDESKDRFIYLGVDVTATDDESVVNFKRDRVLQFLDKGELGKLKYFEDPEAEFKGELRLPMITLVLDPDQVLEMQALMIKKPQERSQEDKERLAEIGTKIEEQVKLQIESIIKTIETQITSSSASPKRKRIYKDSLEKYQEILERIK